MLCNHPPALTPRRYRRPRRGHVVSDRILGLDSRMIGRVSGPNRGIVHWVVDLHPGALARFVRATAVLAMPAGVQEQWLSGMHVDELALEWDSGWRLLPQWVERDWLSADDADKFQPIDQALTAMTDRKDANLWTTTALHETTEWAEIRSLATAALLDL